MNPATHRTPAILGQSLGVQRVLRRWLRQVLYLALATVGMTAFARYNDCTAPLPLTVNIPSVTVPSDLPAGQSIPGARAVFAIPINCTVNPGGNWFITADTGGFTLVPGFTDVYTISGMGNGTGLRLRNAAGTILAPFTTVVTNDSFNLGLAQNGVNTLTGSIELVKTGAPVSGPFGFSAHVHVQNQEWANAGSQTSSTLAFHYTMLATTTPSCAVTTTSVAVALPVLSKSALTGVGSSAGTTPFTIGLLCDNNAKPSISLADATTSSNQGNALTLAPGSSATGVGIQILYQAQPLQLNAAPYTYTSSNTPGTNLAALGTLSGTSAVSFQGRYVQTGTAVTPGTVSALATFTMLYQ